MKKIILILALVMVSGCGGENIELLPESNTEYVPSMLEQEVYPHVSEPYEAEVKYVEEDIKITKEYVSCDTSSSSWIKSATYEPSIGYLILKLKETSYNYCEVPSDVWEKFCSAESHGSYYNQNIKGNYACR